MKALKDAPHGVRVNSTYSDDAGRPAGHARKGARAVAFLADLDSGYMNGGALAIDDGLVIA